MSSADLKQFIKAVEVLKRDYTCGVCSELCKNPITLSKCFHIICSDHFEGLTQCPECNVSLAGCSTFVDDRLGPCIDSARVLDQMLEPFKELRSKGDASVSDVVKRGKQRSTSLERAKVKDLPPKTTSNKRSKQKIDETDDKSKENINMSMLSTSSFKMNRVAIEKRNNKGETTLHVACRLGKIYKITELLNNGANPNTKDNAGWTPLHEVVQNNRLDLVKILLQYNTLIDVPGLNNETPLHEAVRFGHKEIAEELVKHGADINVMNCKGETPLQLATNEMKEVLKKAAENVIQTQTVNITHISEIYTEIDMEDIRIYSTSEFRSVLNKLKTLAKAHSNIHVETKWTKKVTHLIVDAEDDGVCQASLDVLQGIVNSLWIISSKWVTASTETKLEPFANYEVTGIGTTTYKGPINSRFNKYKQLPGIFNGCHFYLHNFNAKYVVSKTVVLTKPILSKLITDAGGVVLRRAPNPEAIPESEHLVPYHAKKDGKLAKCGHYIIFKDIYEPMYNMQHLKALPIGWLIECIEKYELCEPW